MKSLLVGLGNKVHCYLATRPEVESRVLWLPNKALPSREEPVISLSIVKARHAFTCFILMRYARIISPKHGKDHQDHQDPGPQRGGGRGGAGDTSPGPLNLFREKGPHEAFLFFPFWAASSRYFFFFRFPLHCLDSVSERLGRIISNAFSKGWLV